MCNNKYYVMLKPKRVLESVLYFIICLVFLAARAQLLARLVRDYGRASRFIRAGGASSLLALPGASAFDGSTALVAVVFRYDMGLRACMHARVVWSGVECVLI